MSLVPNPKQNFLDNDGDSGIAAGGKRGTGTVRTAEGLPSDQSALFAALAAVEVMLCGTGPSQDSGQGSIPHRAGRLRPEHSKTAKLMARALTKTLANRFGKNFKYDI